MAILPILFMFLEKFRDYFPVSPAIWQSYADCFERIEVPAKTILLQEGAVSKTAFLIEKGCLRVWFDSNGEEVTFQFFFENATVSSIESFKKSIPSLFSIETIEPCVLWRISKKDVDKLLQEVSQQPAVCNLIVDKLFDRTLNYMQHFLSFIRDTPQQRYLHLLENQPHIIHRVAQHYIASYLGISRVHLSRIKNKLARNR